MSNIIITKETLSTLSVSYPALRFLSRTEAQQAECIIFDEQKDTLHILTTNNIPDQYHKLIDIYTKKWYNINSFFTDEETFTQALHRYDLWEEKKEEERRIHQDRIHASGQEAVRLLQETYEKRAAYTEWSFLEEILKLSYQAGASDVHFQTEEHGVQMRLRKDWLLQPLFMFSHEEFSKYIMKIKFMAGAKMNTAQHSQDGRFKTSVIKNEQPIDIDVRASFLPTLRGESIVLRFLDESSWITDVSSLGMSEWHSSIISQELQKHHGLILVTWPTGSWKTTTVYTLLHQLNHPDKKIITLEDPVEYEIDGITQSQINESAWYTFEEGLKGILRHDPDIIVVGEMRTLASAQLAVNAAITGHLVISTIHTNTAVEAISRLLNMGIPPFMLTAALNCIVWQRLLRKATHPLPVPIPAQQQAYLDALHARFKQVTGKEFPSSEHLYSLGTDNLPSWSFYAGRIGVFECVTLTAELKEAILQWATTIALQKLVDDAWFLSMQDDAWIKMLNQQTTIEEIERVV